MKAQLDAVAGMLEPIGPPVHVVAAPHDSLPPYFVVAPKPPTGVFDDRVGADDPAVRFDLFVTAVAGTPAGAMDLLVAARDILRPGGRASRPAVADYQTRLDFDGFDVADVDPSVTIPLTNRNPAYAVDSYRLASTPV